MSYINYKIIPKTTIKYYIINKESRNVNMKDMNKDNANKHIGKICQQYRLKNSLTQNQVAELTGLEPRHISQIERGMSKGSIDTLIKLCNAYQITPDIILYDLLDDDIKNSVSIYDEKFKKLSKRDKDSILHFIDYYLSR